MLVKVWEALVWSTSGLRYLPSAIYMWRLGGVELTSSQSWQDAVPLGFWSLRIWWLAVFMVLHIFSLRVLWDSDVVEGGFCTDLSCAVVVPFSSSGAFANGPSHLNHFPFWLLQCVLREPAFEYHLEATSGPNAAALTILNVRKYAHVTLCWASCLGSRFPSGCNSRHWLSLLKPWMVQEQVICRSACP